VCGSAALASGPTVRRAEKSGKVVCVCRPVCVCVCVFDSVIGVGRGMEDLLISIVPVTFGLL